MTPVIEPFLLNGTGPARAGGARCAVEAETTCEPHHLRCARSLVAAPVERDGPPAAVAAAFLVLRRRRGGSASATERIHWGTTWASALPRSRGGRLRAASTGSATAGPSAPLIDFRRTPRPPLRPATSGRSAEAQRRTVQRRRPDQKRKTPEVWLLAAESLDALPGRMVFRRLCACAPRKADLVCAS